MAAVEFETVRPGCYRVTGPLQFDTAAGALEESRGFFHDTQGQIEFDLSGVGNTDSAGLALVV